MRDPEVREACWAVELFIDAAGGTGGGIFRHMYARFLSEAAAITGDTRLADCGAEIHAVGDQWQQVAGPFAGAAHASDVAPGLHAESARLLEVAAGEQQVWEHLANATLGGNRYGPPTGVAVLERVADQIARQGTRYRAASITTGLEVAVHFRRDNARYLRERFPDEADLAHVADGLEQAADRYAAALAAVANGVADRDEARQIATVLREAAAAERRVGTALLARATGT